MKTQPLERPFRVCALASGELAVQRFHDGKVQRWGVYGADEKAKADGMCRIANAGLRKEQEEAA